MFRRFPKRGFTNAMFRKEFVVVNIKAIDARFDDGAEVTAETLVQVGLIPDTKTPVKVLGEGELAKKLTVTASAFSTGARQKIEAAGGSATTA